MVGGDTAVDAAIVADRASKLFLDGAVVAFHQLSLAVRRNEIMCVVGPSGCGKTTLLRCIAGLTDLSSGTLLVHNKPVGARPPDGVAMVFQHFGLLPWKTVFDNAAFGLAMTGVPRSEIKARVTHYLDLVGLMGFEDHYPYQLSGGMQQRVGLVRALVMNPSLLLMDEPFAALDAQTREILQEELLALMERPDERKTMVFITHSIDEAILLGDRIAVMSARPGRVKEVLSLPIGFAFAVVLGIGIGLLLARFWVLDVALTVYITFLYSIPSVALVPLIVLWAGFDITAKVIILFLFAFFPMVINPYQGVKSVDPKLLEVGHAFRCSEGQLWWNIVLPASLPFIVTGLRLALGRGLIGMVLADLYTAISGIGYLIVRTASTYQVDKMFVPIVTLGLLGVTLTALLRLAEKYVAPWTAASQED